MRVLKITPRGMQVVWRVSLTLTLAVWLASWVVYSPLLSSTAQAGAAIVCLASGWLSGYGSAVRDATAALAADLARRNMQNTGTAPYVAEGGDDVV